MKTRKGSPSYQEVETNLGDQPTMPANYKIHHAPSKFPAMTHITRSGRSTLLTSAWFQPKQPERGSQWMNDLSAFMHPSDHQKNTPSLNVVWHSLTPPSKIGKGSR